RGSRCHLARRGARSPGAACAHHRNRVRAGARAAAPAPRPSTRACYVKHARSVAAFCWDFVVGDDWRLASGVILALGSTVVVQRLDLPAWWLLPVALVLLLADSVRRAVRR